MADQTKTYPDLEELAAKRAKSKALKKCIFVDDSAKESDGEGGDISSTQSSPAIFPQDPPRKFVNCDLCGLLLSSAQQRKPIATPRSARNAEITRECTSALLALRHLTLHTTFDVTSPTIILANSDRTFARTKRP